MTFCKKQGKTGWFIGGGIFALMMVLLAEYSTPPRNEIATSSIKTLQKDFHPILQNIKTIPEHLLDEKAERQTLLVARLSGVPEPANGPMAVLSRMEEIQMPYLDQFDMSAVKVPAAWNTDWLLEIIQKDPSVDYAYKQSKAELFRVIPNDMDFGDQTNLHDPDNDVDVDAPEAWAYTTGSKNVVVAVLDAGFHINNPDLRPNLWINEAELRGRPDIDDDNNGCIDDIHGCDLETSNGKNLTGFDPEHGTEVSSVLASRGNDGYRITGVAWNIRIMLLQGIASRITAYQYILKMKRQFDVDIRVVNYSAGTYDCNPLAPQRIDYTDEHSKLSELRDEGIVLIQAIGNRGINVNGAAQQTILTNPGCHNLDNIIVVAGQSKTTRTRWSETDYGSKIGDLYAPAERVPTSPQRFVGGHPLNPSGTSLAAPHVAGAAALLWSFKPDLTVAQVRSALLDTVDRFDSFKLRDENGVPTTDTVASGGALNIANALYSVATPGIRIHSSQTTIAEGASGYIDLSLTREPVRPSTGQVVVLEGVTTPLSDAAAVVTPSTLTFTSANWHIPQRMSVRAAGISGSEVMLEVAVAQHLSTTHYHIVPMRTATMTLQSDGIRPTLHIPSRIAEGDITTATIRFSDPLINAATFDITAAGTAVEGEHYNTLPPTITAAPGSTSATFAIETIENAGYNGPDKTIHLQITTDNDHILRQDLPLQATLTIEDKDTPIMTITVFPRAITQSNIPALAPTATATIQLDRNAVRDVTFSLSARPIGSDDISHLFNDISDNAWPVTATIAQDATSTEIIIHSLDYDDDEGRTHWIRLSPAILPNAAARLGQPNRALLITRDDDGDSSTYIRLRVFLEGAVSTDTATIQTDP